MRRLSLIAALVLLASVISNQPIYAKNAVIPSETEALELLQGICGKDNVFEEDNQLGCGGCPSFTKVPEPEADNGFFAIEKVVYGSFTESTVKEAVVDFFGCEGHANQYGGSVLVRRSSKGWSFISYFPGLRANNCLKFSSPNSRSSLVCKNRYMNHTGSWEWLSAIEFGKTKNRENVLLSVGSNVDSGRPPYQEILILDWYAQDTNKDGFSDLVAIVREAKAKTEPRGLECEPYEPCLPNPKIHQLVFLFNGQSFRPTPQTAKLKQQFERR